MLQFPSWLPIEYLVDKWHNQYMDIWWRFKYYCLLKLRNTIQLCYMKQGNIHDATNLHAKRCIFLGNNVSRKFLYNMLRATLLHGKFSKYPARVRKYVIRISGVFNFSDNRDEMSATKPSVNEFPIKVHKE